MAILSHGILGPITGRTGPVISYQRFGQTITRGISDTRKNKIETPARKIQREKIKVCNEFTKAFTGTGFFDKTFPQPGHTGSGYNRVTSSIMNLALITIPETRIAWNKVLISKGELAPVEFAAVAVNEEGNIQFTWTNNSGTGTAKDIDTAVLVAFFPESKEVVFELSKSRRSDGSAILKMNGKEGKAETWLGFLSADGKNAANSVYTGNMAM